ncbi:MAG TPA: enoyl-CoA hydratase-related protein [Candidatus Limnocylindrales bacterium]|nr:enoyl-CoA hydratase-related protein [Candidatus Limnocylindrales bacterium]
MAEPLVRLSADPRGVAWLTLARPERRNAFDAQLIGDLTLAVARVDPASRAVVLASEGDAFCAGADLNWMKSMVDYGIEQNAADSRTLSQMFAALDALPMPLLARVQGAAIGGGAGLVAVADIAIASTEATFGFTEVRLGIIPAVVSPYVVRRIGVARATTLFVSGMRFDAPHALDIGLVDAVDAPDELDAKLELYLEAIIAGGPLAVRAAKRIARDVTGRPIDEVREHTIERIAAVRVSPEGQEGMRAFLERRKARWEK